MKRFLARQAEARAKAIQKMNLLGEVVIKVGRLNSTAELIINPEKKVKVLYANDDIATIKGGSSVLFDKYKKQFTHKFMMDKLLFSCKAHGLL